jgi:hypothetical protein
LLNSVNRLVPTPVKPSYVYLATYHPAAVLKRHVDRPQCEWNVSLVLDMEPEVARTSAWPIFLETAGTVHEVRLGLGDLVLYRGTDVPHWRDRQPDGQRCTVAFFHFVGVDFTGSLS